MISQFSKSNVEWPTIRVNGMNAGQLHHKVFANQNAPNSVLGHRMWLETTTSKRHSILLLLTCTVFNFLAVAGSAKAGDNATLERQLELTTKPLNDLRDRFTNSLEKDADRALTSNKIRPEFRERTREKLLAALNVFKTTGQLPTDDDLIDRSIGYLEEFYTRRYIAFKKYDSFEKKYASDSDLLSLIERERQRWSPPGGQLAQSRQRWHGTRTFKDGNTVDFHVHIDLIDGQAVEGTLWQDADTIYKKGWKYKGVLDGSRFTLQTTQRIDGNGAIFVSRGYIIGKRMVMKSFDDKGAPIDRSFSVRL